MHDEGRLDGPGPAYSNIGFDVGNVAMDAKNIVGEDGTTRKPQPAVSVLSTTMFWQLPSACQVQNPRFGTQGGLPCSIVFLEERLEVRKRTMPGPSRRGRV